MSTGFMMCIIVAFHLLVPKLRPIATSHGFVTPGDWVRHRFGAERFGRALLRVVGVLMALALANFLFAQLKAMGEMADTVTGGIISYEAGVVLLAAMILFYETLGGMRAVAWTDAVQGVLMLVGLGSMLVWLLGAAGGLSAMTEAVVRVRPAAVAVPDARECANWASTIVLPPGDPARLRGSGWSNSAPFVRSHDLHAAHDHPGGDAHRARRHPAGAGPG
jgi:Na+/proline symporter